MEFKIAENDLRISGRLQHLEEIKAMIDVCTSDESVIRGTDRLAGKLSI